MSKWILKTDIPLYYPDKTLPAYSVDELKMLTEKYLQDASYRNILIESQMRLTLTIASMYRNRYRHDQEELVSDALFSLVRAVERYRVAALIQPDSNLEAYVNRTIWLELKQTALQNRLIPIPPSVVHRKLRDGTLDCVDVVSLLGDERVYDRSDHTLDIEQSDYINVAINCDEQKKILRMRIAKYEGQEIADELRVRVSYVWNRCKEIRQSLSLSLSE